MDGLQVDELSHTLSLEDLYDVPAKMKMPGCSIGQEQECHLLIMSRWKSPWQLLPWIRILLLLVIFSFLHGRCYILLHW